ncbi:MAG: hypothetical protein HDT18_09800 [Oscillibacter sp.]|nr:hypothetical protein [Oscillibacter sp.]
MPKCREILPTRRFRRRQLVLQFIIMYLAKWIFAVYQYAETPRRVAGRCSLKQTRQMKQTKPASGRICVGAAFASPGGFTEKELLFLCS